MKADIEPYKSREALLETIACAKALANTSTSTGESLHWSAREQELRAKAGAITPEEEAAILAVVQDREATYGSNA